jgi:hypothetical protein
MEDLIRKVLLHGDNKEVERRYKYYVMYRGAEIWVISLWFQLLANKNILLIFNLRTSCLNYRNQEWKMRFHNRDWEGYCRVIDVNTECCCRIQARNTRLIEGVRVIDSLIEQTTAYVSASKNPIPFSMLNAGAGRAFAQFPCSIPRAFVTRYISTQKNSTIISIHCGRFWTRTSCLSMAAW